MPLSAETALLSLIDEHLSAGRPLTLAIDGCCAAGKTTLALRLQQRYGCPVFHADDYFLQPHQRTPQRLSQAGGNMDRERLLQEVLLPLSRGEDVVFRRFDCSAMALRPPVRVPYAPFQIVEGTYCMHPELAPYYTASVFLRISPAEQRRRIEEMLGVKAYNSFGMSEMCGPGVAFECREQNGLHIWEDYYIVEIVDPETLRPVPDGEVGELVLTTLNREAMPLLRYRTRDLTRILPGECPCGRHHKRLDRMKGRSDDMMILKGVNIFPIQIETILLQFEELTSNYLITLETRESNDEMTVEVELGQLFTDDYGRLQELTREITRRLKDEILVTPRVKLLPKGSLPQSEGKAVRVKDIRKHF